MIALVALVLPTTLASAYMTFPEWTVAAGKRYDVLEYAYREQVYNSNVEKVKKHNSGNHSYTMSVNKFADLTHHEFAAKYLMPPRYVHGSAVKAHGPFPYVDWKVSGFVPEVKDQGQCGSCWAFSAAEALSAHFAIWYNTSAPTLSPQELVDCVPAEYNCFGCGGGWPTRAMEYALTHLKGGLEQWKVYPYTAQNGQCNLTNIDKTIVVNATKVHNVTAGSQSELLNALSKYGPVSVCIDAEEDFQFYKAGIYTSTGCSSNRVDHAVLLYGLYSDPSTGRRAYMIRNSWGQDNDGSDLGWGDQGDIFFDADAMDGNLCAIAMDASYVYNA